MSGSKLDVIANQVFVGLPWRTTKPKYEKIAVKLEQKYPIHFTIVGRNDGQDAVNLFEVIKSRIRSSSHAILDATGGNANVSLEFGFAEGIDVPRSIFISNHKASKKSESHSPIISDLSGQRRVQYKNEAALRLQLEKFCKDHNYTKRFEAALKKILKNVRGGRKKRLRSLALKIVRQLDDKGKIRRFDAVNNLQSKGYSESDIELILKRLHRNKLLNCSPGQRSEVRIA